MERLTPEAMERVAERFKTLSEPMRLRLLNALRTGEKTVTELTLATGAGQANVSKHLALLYRHRIVSRRKKGLHVYYRIADPVILRLCDLVCTSLEAELDAGRRALAPVTARAANAGSRPAARPRPARGTRRRRVVAV
jgi:DNA-binding transcriptional ArsR family regulator